MSDKPIELEQDQGIDVEAEKVNFREIERQQQVLIPISLTRDEADIILRSLAFKMRTIGRNTAEFRICQRLVGYLEGRTA